MLRSKEKIEIEKILDFDKKKELINYLIMRKIQDLSYLGFEKIFKYLEKNIGLKIILDDAKYRMVVETIALRNIIVHNNGKINQKFIEQTGHKKYVIGENFHFDEGDLRKRKENLLKIVDIITKAALNKFGSKRKGSNPDCRNRGRKTRG